jgi:hypothetical protein
MKYVSILDYVIFYYTLDFRHGQEIFCFPTRPYQFWDPASFLINGYRGAISPKAKRPGCEVDHAPPSSAEVRFAWSCISTPPCVFMAWCLIINRDNFTLYYITPSSSFLGYSFVDLQCSFQFPHRTLSLHHNNCEIIDCSWVHSTQLCETVHRLTPGCCDVHYFSCLQFFLHLSLLSIVYYFSYFNYPLALNPI